MWKFLKYIHIYLKYLINAGPVIYEVVKWGTKIVREFRKPKIIPAHKPELQEPKPEASPDLDPG